MRISPKLGTWSLGALIVLPALAFWPAVEAGHVVAVLYRQPKAALVSLLGWVFLVVWVWVHRRAEGDRLWRAAISWPMGFFLALVSWMMLSGAWSRVPENHVLELRGWILVFLIVGALVASRGAYPIQAPRSVQTVKLSLVGAAGLVTVIGLAQLVIDIPGLVAIDADRYGVVQTATFGYKNPAALFIAGQILLLVGVVADSSGRSRWAWGALLVAEIFYLTSLQSRTALLAFTAGMVAFGLFAALGGRRQGLLRRGSLWTGPFWAGAALLIAFLGLMLVPASRERAQTLFSRLEPAAYLQSDRGVYALNTLAMVGEHPAGVGLGEWQTHYPVFRSHGRDIAFDGLHQVRRAHADHIQVLGELGWPGLILWAALWLTAGWMGLQAARKGSLPAAAATAQLVVFAVAMAGDYVVEMPYHRLQFGLILAVVLIESRATGDREKIPEKELSMALPWATRAAILAFGLVVLGEMAGVVAAHRGALAEADVERAYRSALAQEDSTLRRRGLERAALEGEALASVPFHSKTRFRADLMAAHSEYLLGRSDVACHHLERSLSLYPFNPPALRLASKLSDDQELRGSWDVAAQHVEEEASHGFAKTYPSLPCGDGLKK